VRNAAGKLFAFTVLVTDMMTESGSPLNRDVRYLTLSSEWRSLN